MGREKNKMQPTNPNAHTYVNGYAVTQNNFCNSLFEQSCIYRFPSYQSAVWNGQCRVWSVKCRVRSVECKVWSVECKV